MVGVIRVDRVVGVVGMVRVVRMVGMVKVVGVVMGGVVWSCNVFLMDFHWFRFLLQTGLDGRKGLKIISFGI